MDTEHDNNMGKADSVPMLNKEEKPRSLTFKDDTAAPHDYMKLVYLFFFLHGIGILLPWNSFINAKSYFEDHKLNVNNTYLERKDYSSNFMTYVGYASQFPNMLMSAFNVFYQSSLPQKGSSVLRITLALFIEIAVCILTLILALVNSYEWPETFFLLTMFSVIVLNCCSGVYQSSLFGMAGGLPMEYSNAIIIGNNFCGTLIAVVDIVCKASSANDQKMAAVYYFSCVILLLVLCLNSMFVIKRLQFYQYYQNGGPQTVETNHDNQLLVEMGEKKVVEDEEDSDKLGEQRGVFLTTVSTLRNCFSLCCFAYPKSKRKCSKYWSRYHEAFKDCWVHCISVWSVFFCTLSCFPALQSSVKPANNEEPFLLSEKWFASVFVFLFFNLFAMVGNLVSNYVQLPPPRWLALVVWIRTIVCIPFFFFCNVQPMGGRNLPVYIRWDLLFVFGQVIFSFTSGYFSSLGMMYAPRCVKNKDLSGIAGMLSAFFLTFGIISGILFGGVLIKLV